MIELARHIEILLLENDCVIVPELGGFIAHYQPAYYAESDNIYFPPMRTIGFNPQLTMNDGLLVPFTDCELYSEQRSGQGRHSGQS